MGIPLFNKRQVLRLIASAKAVEQLTDPLPDETSTILDGSQWFWGVIVNEAPGSSSSSSAFTDNRYWIKRAYPSNSDGNPISLVEWEALPETHSQYTHVCATSLYEEAHTLAAGTPCVVYWDYDNSDPPIPKFFFVVGGGGSIELLYIDSGRSRYEVYKAYIVNLTDTEFETGSSDAFNFSQIGNITDSTEVTAINAQEGDGALGHALTDYPPRLRLVFGYRLPCVDDAGRACYLIVAKDFETDCSTPSSSSSSSA